MPKMVNFLCENHRGSPTLTLLNVPNARNLLNVLNGLNVIKMTPRWPAGPCFLYFIFHISSPYLFSPSPSPSRHPSASPLPPPQHDGAPPRLLHSPSPSLGGAGRLSPLLPRLLRLLHRGRSHHGNPHGHLHGRRQLAAPDAVLGAASLRREFI